MDNYVRYQSPWRKVISDEFRYCFRGRSYVITLECGHTDVKKYSQPVPARARCWQCPPDQEAIRYSMF